ncbi:GNAT family N-acetyltransferase [Gorillibacterium sp. sgz500922]|uniref:GNAT family N-acetyltransferase n=1 Tax=Gorillibacterium sp. sgz500922 TaxID=3446694 RepID=UPI003F674006
MIHLESERLAIRNFTPEDFYDLHEYLSQEEVLKYEPDGPSDLDNCRKMATERSQGEAFLAVTLKESGKMIGHVYLGQTEPAHFRTWMIGYIFNPSFYGNGYATEACRRIMDHAFAEGNAHRIVAMCNTENAPSWRLLERLGMRREGHFKQEGYFRESADGQPIWHDAYQYAVLAEEWMQRS